MTKNVKIALAVGAAGGLVFLLWPKSTTAPGPTVSGDVILGTPTVTGKSAIQNGTDYGIEPQTDIPPKDPYVIS